MYLHRIIAENKLNRYLQKEEYVHHINENKLDNSTDNLLIFKSNADHFAYHRGCEISLDNDVYISNYSHNSKICPECGKTKAKEAEMCQKCSLETGKLYDYYMSRRKVMRPLRNELENLICKYPITTIAKKYGVTDNAVRKWLLNYGLPTKKSDIRNFRLNCSEI